MSKYGDAKITISAEGVERVLRRMIAAKEVLDMAIESVADLLIQARPEGSSPEGKSERPATFSGAPAETADDVPGWQRGDKDGN